MYMNCSFSRCRYYTCFLSSLHFLFLMKSAFFEFFAMNMYFYSKKNTRCFLFIKAKAKYFLSYDLRGDNYYSWHNWELLQKRKRNVFLLLSLTEFPPNKSDSHYEVRPPTHFPRSGPEVFVPVIQAISERVPKGVLFLTSLLC